MSSALWQTQRSYGWLYKTRGVGRMYHQFSRSPLFSWAQLIFCRALWRSVSTWPVDLLLAGEAVRFLLVSKWVFSQNTSLFSLAVDLWTLFKSFYGKVTLTPPQVSCEGVSKTLHGKKTGTESFHYFCSVFERKIWKCYLLTSKKRTVSPASNKSTGQVVSITSSYFVTSYDSLLEWKRRVVAVVWQIKIGC